MVENLFQLTNLTDFPTLEAFLQYSLKDIQLFCQQYHVLSCYLPIDGTRRYFLAYNSEKQRNQNDSDNISDYYNIMVDRLITLLQNCYDCGIKIVILLLMDDSAFSRGKKYLYEAVQLGILPLLSHTKYLTLYEKYDIDVSFAGFVEQYVKYGFPTLVDDFSQLHQNTLQSRQRQLILYTGSTTSDDYLLLFHKAEQLKAQGVPVTRENLLLSIYNTKNLEPYDFSIWYGFPRDKIVPPLLWDKGVKFYINRPTMGLTLEQIKKAIYYTALAKHAIRDEYIDYTKDFSGKISYMKKYFSEQDDFIGIHDYIVNSL